MRNYVSWNVEIRGEGWSYEPATLPDYRSVPLPIDSEVRLCPSYLIIANVDAGKRLSEGLRETAS